MRNEIPSLLSESKMLNWNVYEFITERNARDTNSDDELLLPYWNIGGKLMLNSSKVLNCKDYFQHMQIKIDHFTIFQC